MDDQNKNLLLATALSFAVIMTWFILFPPEEPPADAVEGPVATEMAPSADLPGADGAAVPQAAATGDGDLPQADPVAGLPAATADSPEPEAEAPRIQIDTPALTGSISLEGGRIDDLALLRHKETLDPDSPPVSLLKPDTTVSPYFVLHGWSVAGGIDPSAVPGPSTVWTAEEGAVLTHVTPVTLTWDNGQGQVFRKTISVDEDYLFTVTQSVENAGDAPIALAPYALIRRAPPTDSTNFFILHEGVVRMSDGTLEEIDYDDIPDLEAEERSVTVSENGWTGFTDKYWMTTLIPAPGSGFRSVVRPTGTSYQAETVYPTITVEPGATAEAESFVFAGAKEWEVIRRYQNENGIQGFLDSIDWGWFFFLTKPIFWLLHNINALIGNMGWSIIILTLVIKALLLPLAYRSYVSMAKMKELQPEMEKLKERAGDDRQALQQGMMELYKKNKVNPASGCLPILLQIPIFFSLYKVIFVTIELRHAPWIGWIKDLSAPDPSSILNLFGLLPYAPPEPGTLLGIFSLGVLPICLGISMWLQQKLNPAPPDPTQRMVFAWLPWIFMFMLGGFASGLVLYWIANNVITFTQQYLIMRSQGYKPDIIGNILGRNAPEPANKATKPAATKKGDK